MLFFSFREDCEFPDEKKARRLVCCCRFTFFRNGLRSEFDSDSHIVLLSDDLDPSFFSFSVKLDFILFKDLMHFE